MRGSVVLTLYNREAEVILAVIRSLRRSLPDGWEVICVDDGSTNPNAFVRTIFMDSFPSGQWIKAPEYEAYRIGGAFNNPARAFNLGLAAATGDIVAVMSSDTLVTPDAFSTIAMYAGKLVVTPRVIDLETSMEYCGPARVFPMPWLLAAPRKVWTDAGPWDEQFLKGICYEDNDLVGRLVLVAGGFVGDWQHIVYHMSHHQIAYEVARAEANEGRDINRRYILSKWTGIPFDSEKSPFDVKRKPHSSGLTFYECLDRTGKIVESFKAKVV